MPNENQLHTKSGQKRSMIQLPVRKNVENPKVKFSKSLFLKTSQGSSKIIDRDIKKIESVIYQDKQPIVPNNFKISKEVTITSITHVNDTEDTILKLKKLPGITIELVKSEPVFKVPKSPKLKTKNNKKNITPYNKTKIFFEKKGLSERRDDNIDSSTTKSSDKSILKNPEAFLKKYPVLEKENVQRTSSPKKLSKKILSSSKIKSKSLKTIKTVEEISNNCKIFSKEVNSVEKLSNNCNIFSKDGKISDKIINNTELANENYMLMDLSTDSQFNIVPASFPSDFMNVNVPEYNNFLIGISKSPKDSIMHLDTSQNDTDKGSLITKEELGKFSDFLGCVKTSLNINESNDIHSELPSQSSNNVNPSLDNIKDEQLYINYKSKENIIGKYEDKQKHNSNFYLYNHTSKQPYLKDNYMNQTTDTLIKQEDNQLLQKVTNYYCDNLIGNIPKN